MRVHPFVALAPEVLRPLARACPRSILRSWQSVNSLARCLPSLGRYAAFIFACARSNTANPESLPDIPNTQPLA